MTDPIRKAWQVRPRGVFYGWWIVLIATVLAAIASGAYFSGLSAFFLHLTEEFDVSRGTLASVISLASIQTALLGPFQGYVVDRFGPRRLMWFGVAMAGLGFVLISTAQSFLLFSIYLVCLLPLGVNLGLTFPVAAAVGNWFIKRRGTAFGIAMSGFGFGWVLVIGTNFLIESLGWRGAAATLGCIIWGVGFPLASLVRHRPEQYGMLPDGDKRVNEGQSLGPIPDATETDFSPKQALKTSALWWILWSYSFRSFVNVAISVHFMPAVQDKGFSSATAAAVFGLLGFLSVPSRVGNGLLADVIDKRLVSAVQCSLMILSMLVFIWSTSLWHLLVFVGIYAVTTGGGGSLMYATLGEYFGRRYFGTIIGYSHAIAVIGSIVGPAFAGFAFDATGDYQLAFYGFALASLAALVTIVMVRKPQRPSI